MGPRPVPPALRVYLALLSISSWGMGGCLGLAGDFEIVGSDAQGEDAQAVAQEEAESSAPPSTDATGGVAPGPVVPGPVAPACLPNQYICSGPNLQICNSNQDGYVTLKKCASKEDCNASLKTCTAPPPPPGGGNDASKKP